MNAIPPDTANSAAANSGTAAAVAEACRRIAPLWPLEGFVAVNPFLGLTGTDFGGVCALFDRVTHSRVLMPREFYREALARGEIEDADLAVARERLDAPDMPASVADLRALAADDTPAASPWRVATVAELLDRSTGGDRYRSHVRFMIEEIGAFCAGYFDAGQARWAMPGRERPPYAAWRARVAHDLNPAAMGLRGFRAAVLALPDEPLAAIAAVLAGLAIPPPLAADYLHRALFDIAGWAGHARWRQWQAELAGKTDTTLVSLLAIRVAFGWGLFRSANEDLGEAWRATMREAAAHAADRPATHPAMAFDLFLHEAWEAAWRRRFEAALRGPEVAAEPARVQIAFCIDVRSERMRRALETVAPGIATLGFAGFFGVAIEAADADRRSARCPALIAPQLEAELVPPPAPRDWLAAAKGQPVLAFPAVEAVGLGFVAKLASGLLRRGGAAVARDEAANAALRLNLPLEQAAEIAAGILRGMSLGTALAPLVLLVGHAGTSANNPFAAALDCGACGGHGGALNARAAARLLNDPQVREHLAARGLPIPGRTSFVAALHDTATDTVTVLDHAAVPRAALGPLAETEAALARAGGLVRAERAAGLGLRRPSLARLETRARDWAETRPEWGLAGNAAFIAAPRARTRGIDLGGRVFLHEYDAAQDPDLSVLELILTAPLVVASWINLQYFASVTNNASFGGGNKVLHNITGRLGVMEGHAGDLRSGLPLQSLHDGERFVHEPRRLAAYIAAPETAIETVLARQAGVRDLAGNGWLVLHALAPDGAVRRYDGQGRWRATCPLAA